MWGEKTQMMGCTAVTDLQFMCLQDLSAHFSGFCVFKLSLPTMGSRCSSASPVSEPTARLMQNWMHSWKTPVQAVHSRTTMPNMDVSVITTLARVAYRYSTKRKKKKKVRSLLLSWARPFAIRGVVVGTITFLSHLLSVSVSPSELLASVVSAQAPLMICWTSAGLSRAKPDRPRLWEAEVLSASW